MTDIYGQFACFTKLPVLIDDVRDAILERGVVDRIEFVPASIEEVVLRGMLRVYEELGAYGNRRVAQIVYSKQIGDPRWVRLVCCKELLHILDNESEIAAFPETVNELINHIVVPFEAGLPQHTVSDHLGMFRALQVLVPRDSLYYLRQKVRNEEMAVETISDLAQIPVSFSHFVLSDEWWNYLNPTILREAADD